jgi:hypothetical protein
VATAETIAGDLIATAVDVLERLAQGVARAWCCLREALGDGAIPYGHDAADLAATLDRLDDPTLARARAAVIERRAALEWARLAEPTWELLDEVAARGSSRHPR